MKKLFTACLIASAFVFFIAGIVSMTNTGKDASWKATDGVVLNGELETHFIESTGDNKNGNIYYDAAVSYNFIFNEQTYTGKSIVGNASRNDPSKAQHILESYPEGKIIKILFNPTDPEKSIIDTHSNKKAYMRFLYAFILLVISIFPSVYVEILAGHYPASHPSSRASDGIDHNGHSDHDEEKSGPQESYEPDDDIELPENIIELAGLWDLEYQIPSLREIISSGQNSKTSLSADRNAIMETGFESLSMLITGNVMEMNYKDIKQQGGCCIISKFKLEGNRLELVHKSMDFMIADVQGFPPISYTYIRKGMKLSLMSNAIEGLGNRRITYHFTLSVHK